MHDLRDGQSKLSAFMPERGRTGKEIRPVKNFLATFSVRL